MRDWSVTAMIFALWASSAYAGAEPQKPAPVAKPAAAAPAAHAPAAQTHGAPASSPGASGSTAHPSTTGATAGHITTGSPGATSGHITTGSPGSGSAAPTTANHAAATNHPVTNGVGTAGTNRPAVSARAAGSPSAFGAHAAPAGSHEVHAANGAAIRTRADGSRSDIHDPKRGMDIHRGLDGNRRTTVERPDHSRIVAERGGRGYVQHPYMFHGHEFGHRTYYEHGRAYDRFYGRSAYHGGYLDVYAPARFYPYGFYGYAYAPWAEPVPYAWGWGAAPWYGYYGAYYAPYPVYPAPAFWLADFVIAASLQAAFIAQASTDLGPVPTSPPLYLEASRYIADLLVDPAAADAKPAMSPEVKQAVADEIQAVVAQEQAEARANAAKQDSDPGKNNVAQLLSDGKAHVFVGGTDVDIVAASGQECAFSQGDVLRVATAPADSADTASATVLASKGGKECTPGAGVSVAVTDLQDMHNHMREQVDDGLAELQSKQGKNGLPSAPAGAAAAPAPSAFAASAPAPDADAGRQISEQAGQADLAERDAAAAPAESAASPTTIAAGQSIEQVTAALGPPAKIIDLGARKIYTYPDMKVIFLNGRVTDVD
jgi:hypothetical protein